MWFYQVWEALGLSPILELAPHDDGHKPITFFKNYEKLPSIVFYRNPLDWYGSLYSYHIKTDWQWLPNSKGISFYDFVKTNLTISPMSKEWDELVLKPRSKSVIISEYRCKTLLGSITVPICGPLPPVYMIQYEQMHSDLEIVLNILGFKFYNFNITKELLHGFPKINSGPVHQELIPELREQILKIDAPIFEYYKAHSIAVPHVLNHHV